MASLDQVCADALGIAAGNWKYVLSAPAWAVLFYWQKYREANWRFSSKKSEKFRKSLNGDAWRNYSRMDFAYAMFDAFGRTVSQPEFAFISTRENPIRLLRDRLSCSGLVKFNKDSSDGWKQAGWNGPTGLRVWSVIFVVLGSLLLSAALMAVPMLFTHLTLIAVFLIAYCSLTGGALFWLSGRMEAAVRVIQLSGHNAAEESPGALEQGKRKSDKPHGKSARAAAGVRKPRKSKVDKQPNPPEPPESSDSPPNPGA